MSYNCWSPLAQETMLCNKRSHCHSAHDAQSSVFPYIGFKLNLRDRVLGEVALVLCQSKGATVGSYPQKTMCPNLRKILRSFIEVVQIEYDVLMDILLMGWRWGKKESASSTCRSNWSGVSMFVGSMKLLIINFSYLEGVSVSAK